MQQEKKRRRHLYYQKSLDRWYLRTTTLYISSSRNVEELIPIWEECEAADWQVDKILVIKEKYRKRNPYGKGITYIPRQDKYVLYVWHDGQRKYAGRYNTLDEARAMQQLIIDSGYTLDPVRHKAQYRPRGGKYRYIRPTRSGRYTITKDNEYYGTYSSLEDAVEERDLLESVGWNWDELDGL